MHKYIINTEQGSLETLFVYIFHRLAQAGNKCKQMDFEQSLLSIFGSDCISSKSKLLRFSQLSPLIVGQRVYMLHMLLLPFLPIVALIVQNSGNLHDMMEYRMESVAIGLKVDGTTALGHILDVFKILP